MYNLKNVTFLIPLKVESFDRLVNIYCVLGYLNKNFETNIFIIENDTESKIEKAFGNFGNLSIKHKLVNEEKFHRTKYLNEMLFSSRTPVVVNYDCDIILPVDSYIKARDLILSKKKDFVYPFGHGNFQKMVYKTVDFEKFKKTFEFNDIESAYSVIHTSRYGHCLFSNRDSYINAGAENENFISWGPEDSERYHRYKKFGYTIDWFEEGYVYHMEHERGDDSGIGNSDFASNNMLWDKLRNLKEDDLYDYYKNVEYLKKYVEIKED